MRIAVLGDMHIGSRNASPITSAFQLKFFEDQFFPYLKKHKIDTILQSGDLFDSRRFSNHVILNEWKKRFFDPLQEAGIKFNVLLGNHDIALKNTLKVNTPSLFLSEYDNITIYDTPTEVSYDDMSW